MTNLINPKPRFGYNPSTDHVYDYLTQRDVAPTDEEYESVDGVWDLVEVKRAIVAGEPIEQAHLEVRKIKPHVPIAQKLPEPSKADEAAAKADDKATDNETEKSPGKSGSSSSGAKPWAGTGLSAEQLRDLNLTPVQAAALQITPAQMSDTGVSAEQVRAWGLNEKRANALKLNQEQRAVLLP